MLAQLVLYLATALPQSAPPAFRCVLLEGLDGAYSEAGSINQSGEVVGLTVQPTGFFTAAHWNLDGELTVLGRTDSFHYSMATAINNSGVIVGRGSEWFSFPLIWTRADGAFQLEVKKPSYACAVNDAGDILCRAGLLTNNFGVLVERNGRQHVLAGSVMGLSNDQKVVGEFLQGGAYRWSIGGGYETLSKPVGFFDSMAFGIGEDGTVVGSLWNGAAELGAYWDAAGRPHVLPATSVRAVSTYATDINALGWIVGSQYGTRPGDDPNLPRSYGTLWVDGVGYQLEDLILDGPRVPLPFFGAMNDRGQITGTGIVGGQHCGIRLDPL